MDAVVSDDSLAATLQQMFACSAEVAAIVRRRAADRNFPASAVLVRQGDPCGDTFLVVGGRARALFYGVEGQETLVQEFGPGDLFGPLGPRDPMAYDCDVVALEPCRAAVFSATDFLQLMEAHSSVGLAVSRMLLRQLRAAAGRMVERTTLSAAGRIHAELLRMAARVGGRAVIDPAPSPTDLAKRVQSTRETVSRTLHSLERRGVVRWEGGALLIVAPRRLEEMIV